MELKQGKQISMRDLLAIDAVYRDSKKGDLARVTDLKSVFKTEDIDSVAKQIIERGEIQITAAYRKKLMEEKRKQIIQIIHQNGIDPRTKLPHPQTRIELALEEGKIKIDEHKTAKDQVDGIIKELRLILPIKITTQELKISIPSEYAGKHYMSLKGLGNVRREEWQNNGNLYLEIEIPAGLNESTINKINNYTKGTATIDITEPL